ncbi:MAG: hypothetical protein JWM89_3837, partial [Acidimicrobiales bacterium]|nr:hypothetical protein [Acidimicrobiales bacterium]
PGHQTLPPDQGGPTPNPFQPPIDLDVPSNLEYAPPPTRHDTRADGKGGGGGPGPSAGTAPGGASSGDPGAGATPDRAGSTDAAERADRQHSAPPPRTGSRTPDGTKIDPRTWQRPPPSRFHTLTERRTAQQREQAWHADQIDTSDAPLYAQAQALGMDLSDEPEPAQTLRPGSVDGQARVRSSPPRTDPSPG